MRLKTAATAALALGLLVVAPAAAAPGSAPAGTPGTTTVTPQDVGVTWNTGDTRPGGSFTFSREDGAPNGFGDGSLRLATTDTVAKVQFLTRQDAGVPLAAIKDHVSYWAKQVAANPASPAQVAALNLFIDPDGAGTAYGYAPLILEPVYQSAGAAGVQQGVWQRWEGAGPNAHWWSTRTFPGMTAFSPNDGPSLDAISAANPDAVVQADGYGFNQGSGNPGVTSAVDGLTVGAKTFDFGPRAMTAADCKDGGWRTGFTPGTYRNQGDCVSSFASRT